MGLSVYDALQGYTTSKLFCEPDANITFASSDNVLFKLHITHLNSNSKIFAVPEDAFLGSEIVHLPEVADVLEILFQFIEPPPTSRNDQQPSVLDMDPGLIFRLAEAAEKYIVYGAMNVCLTRMPDLMLSRPFDVLNHCAKHGYSKVADKAAKRTLESPNNSLEMAVSKLTAPGVLPRWVLYYNAWRRAAISAANIFEQNLKPNSPCHVWPHLYAAYLHDLNRYPLLIAALPTEPSNKQPCTIEQCTCNSFGRNMPWFHEVDVVVNAIPLFSDIEL